MKKILLVCMVVIFAFTLSACGKKKQTTTTGTAEQTAEQTPEEVVKLYDIKNNYNTFSLYSNGEVYAKGTNKCGELGLGHKVQISEETKIEGLTGIQKIVLQQNKERGSAYFINGSGEVYVAGYNEYGQLGLGHNEDVVVPTKIEGLNGIIDIEISEYETCNTYFITQNGEVYVSGANKNGELGLGHKNQVLVPTKIDALNAIKIKKIVYAEGFGYAVFLTDTGMVCISGCGEITEQAVEEAVSEQLDLSILESLFSGNLGVDTQNQDATNQQTSNSEVNQEPPQEQVKKANDPTIPTKLGALKAFNIVDIADEGNDRDFKLYYITDAGEVYASGFNRSGVLGIDTKYNREDAKKNVYISGVFPQKVTALNGVQIKARVDKRFIGINDEKYEIISGDVPRARQVK